MSFLPAWLPIVDDDEEDQCASSAWTHPDWCDIAIYEDGKVRSCGRVSTAPDQLQLFAQSLGPDDREQH